jgi:hypothetical protein
MQQVESLRQFGQDLDWIYAHHDELKRQYPEQFVAVYKGRVVAHAPKVETVMKELDRKYGDASGSIAVEYISTKKDELIL